MTDVPTEPGLTAFFAEVAAALGDAAVNVAPETLVRYGKNHLPSGDRRPAGVVYPGSTAEVQRFVTAANTHRIVLYPISTGQNQGLGLRSPVHAGQVVIDLGRRMNRVLELDERLAYAEIEPGVTYQQLYDELGLRGH